MSAAARRVDVAVIALALAVVALVSWPAPSGDRCSHEVAVAWALLPQPGTTP